MVATDVIEIVYDVWGGERHMDHVARFILRGDQVQDRLFQDLLDGYLVNMRGEVAWGGEQEFDNRRPKLLS